MTSSLSTAVPLVFMLALLSGCPTRTAAGLAPDVAPSAPTTDAGDDTSTTNIATRDGAVVDTNDATPLDADGDGDADALDSTGGGPVEQQKLPHPAPLVTGTSCYGNLECATGSCVDGVCCSSAACGACQSCAIAGSLGSCSPVPSLSEDSKNSCTGTFACDGKGRCAAHNGNACNSTADCLSAFCVDGVCCESACNQQCYSCNKVPALRGRCEPLIDGPDIYASVPCGGASSCAPKPSAESPTCLLNDGESCNADADCGSGQCSTYYLDGDGDHYGDPNRSIKQCGSFPNPPPNYTVGAGDCCDTDGNAHPNQFTSFAYTDACGSWDYNCDGVFEKQFTTGPCGGYPAGTPSDCGKACIGVVLGTPLTRYTQACR